MKESTIPPIIMEILSNLIIFSIFKISPPGRFYRGIIDKSRVVHDIWSSVTMSE